MKRRLAALPEDVLQRLRELEESLATTLGDELVALVVHGSAARGGYRIGTSDVDLIVVVAHDDRELLEKIGPALKLARFSARIEGMILRADEIARSADAFPLLYEDVRRTGVCLRGQDPFAEIEVDDEHRRLRIEQELRDARIRLRRVTAEADDESQLAAAIERKVKKVVSAIHALLVLRGHDVPLVNAEVLAAAETVWSVETAPLLAPREKARQAHDALERLLVAAIADVDAG